MTFQQRNCCIEGCVRRNDDKRRGGGRDRLRKRFGRGGGDAGPSCITITPRGGKALVVEEAAHARGEQPLASCGFVFRRGSEVTTDEEVSAFPFCWRTIGQTRLATVNGALVAL